MPKDGAVQHERRLYEAYCYSLGALGQLEGVVGVDDMLVRGVAAHCLTSLLVILQLESSLQYCPPASVVAPGELLALDDCGLLAVLGRKRTTE